MAFSFDPIRRLALAALSALVVTPVLADVYPSRTIKLVVPAPPGGPADVLARLYGTKIAESWKATVVVENKPGAGGSIAANQVAKSAPDGYTVLVTIPSLVQQMSLMKLPYDPLKDFQPISRIVLTPSVFAVPKNTPAKNLQDFIALVKAKPGEFNFGSYGAGTSAHLQGALLNLQTGMDMAHVPYQGAAPLMLAMLSEQLKSAFLDTGTAKPHVEKLKLLGVTGTARVAWLPGVPTFKEQGLHSFESLGWIGMLMPAGTPKPVVDKFSMEVRRIAKLPEIIERINDMGLVNGGDSVEEFTDTLKSDAKIYSQIIKDANIKIN